MGGVFLTSLVLNQNVSASELPKGKKYLTSKIGIALIMVASMLVPTKTFGQVDFCSSIGEVNLISVKRTDRNHGLITFSLTDKNGNSIDRNISPDEISLKINTHEVCEKTISREKSGQLDLIIAVDVSKSMDDAIEALEEGLPDLINSIAKKYDTYGAVTTFGYGTYEECASTFKFITKPFLRNISINPDNFIIENYIVTTNTRGYNYEGYYSMLLQIADFPYDYRPQAQKAIIMLGNEEANAPTNSREAGSPTNDMDCLNGGRKISQGEVAETLRDKGFQVFIINGNPGFDQIASATGGKEYGVYPTDYTESVLPDISKKMTTIYTMHFEFCDYVPDCGNDIPVNLTICNKSSKLNTTLDYTPVITRSNRTIALSEDGVVSNKDIKLSFSVDHSNCKEIDRTVITYSYIDRYGIQKEGEAVCETSTEGFSANIPAENVNPNMIEYTIVTYFTDGTTVSSSPISTGTTGHTWTIPVKKASAPKIENVSWSGDYTYPCGKKQVCAEVTDEDGTINNVYILYSDYIPGFEKYSFANSEKMTTSDGLNYCVELPEEVGSAQGLAYYIYAEDNDGLKGYYGNGNESYNTLVYETPSSDETIELKFEKLSTCRNKFYSNDYVEIYYEGCNGALVSAGKLTHITNDEHNQTRVFLNTDSEHQNGIKIGEPVYIVMYKETDDGRFVSSKYQKFDYLEDHMLIGLCPEKNIDDMISVYSDENVKISNGDIVKINDATIRSLMTFDIEDDSEEENDWTINSIKVVPSTNFTVSPNNIKDSTIAFGDKLSFTVTYEGDEDAEADLYIYNNTKTDPMVIHLIADVPDKCGDKIETSQRNLIGIKIENNQEYVEFKAKDKNGEIIASYEGFIGRGIQNRYVPSDSLDYYYVELTKNGETCREHIDVNKEENSEESNDNTDKYDDCKGTINSITTQYVTMADIHLENTSVLYTEVLNLNGTSTGNIFGPQLMGAQNHNLYLGPQLNHGTYILKVIIDNKICSSTFTVK